MNKVLHSLAHCHASVVWWAATGNKTPVAFFTKDVNWRLAKRRLVFNGRLANRQLTSLVKEATGRVPGANPGPSAFIYDQLLRHPTNPSRYTPHPHIIIASALIKLLWRHNGCYGASNHQPHDCLLNRLFRRRSKKTSKLHVTGLCAGNSPGSVNSPHKWSVTRKMFPFDDVIMKHYAVQKVRGES